MLNPRSLTDVGASPHSSTGASDPSLSTPPPVDPYASLPYPHQLFPGSTPIDIYPNLNNHPQHLPIFTPSGQASFGYPQMSDGLYNASAINGGAMNAALGAGGRTSWDESNQAYSAGQKRQYDLEGFFDDVKKRKVDPAYDHGASPLCFSSLDRIVC